MNFGFNGFQNNINKSMRFKELLSSCQVYIFTRNYILQQLSNYLLIIKTIEFNANFKKTKTA